MAGIHRTLFHDHFPQISEQEALEAFRRGVAVSVNGYQVSPGFVLRFATEKDSLPPVVLSEFVVEQLRALLNPSPTGASVQPNGETS